MKCPHCKNAELEQHKRLENMLVCPKCWWKYNKRLAELGQFVRIKAEKKVRYGKILEKQTRVYITIVAHKPAGIWKDTWYSVTCAIYVAGQPVRDLTPSRAWSEPFADPKEIGDRVDKMKAQVLREFLHVKFEMVWVKEDPTLSWRRPEQGTKDWKEVFNTC